MSDIVAGVITYNPNIKDLKKSLLSISGQVDELIIVDNGSKNIDEIKKICLHINAILFENKKNEGVSKALNVIMRTALELSAEWCVYFDQDSVMPKNMISSYLKFLSENLGCRIGALVPQIYDRNEDNNIVINNNIEEKISMINSGALINTNVWQILGGYDENLFVDLVDYDFSIRLNENGYKIIQINSVVLNHSIGNIVIKKLFKHKIIVYNHSAFRKYHLTKASVYLRRKHKRYIKKYKYLQYIYLRFLKRALIILIYENEKGEKIRQMINGIIDGNKQENVKEK